jgi:Condensation domain/Phosphopantetheine attachment site/AMP-binding enzyme C-terminal domain
MKLTIRDHRVDLAEVEDALNAYPDIVGAAVCARRTDRGEPKLTAYVIPRAGRRVRARELLAALDTTLPDHAVPTVVGFIDRFPVDSRGELDRERLALVEPAGAPGPRTPPATELERRLARIWEEVFGRDDLGREEEFFALGGDPVTAAEIASAARESLGVELHPRDFARTPTVAAMAERLERLSGPETAAVAGIARTPRTGPVPCSFSQERIWRYSRTPETSSGYTVACESRILGPLSVAAMRMALDDVVRAHEVLRTTYVERDGVPLQVIGPAFPIDIPLINLGGHDPDARLAELLREQSEEPFDLERGPLIRMQLVRVAVGDHRLLRTSHHLLFDQRSWRVFLMDLARAYEARRRGEDPFTLDGRPEFADFAIWERQRLRSDGPLYRQEVEWWRRAFEAERPAQALPFERAEPVADAAREDGKVTRGIGNEATRALDDVGRSAGATSYALRLAIFAALLGLETGGKEVQLGTYATNRRTAPARSMLGFFSNMITLIMPFDRRLSFRSWLVRVMATVADAGAHRQLPYEQLCDELRRGGVEPPEVRAMFQVHERWLDVGFGDTKVESPRYRFQGMPWGFSLVVSRPQQGERWVANFDPRIHDPVGVQLFLEHLEQLGARVGAEPDRPLEELAPG